MTKHIISIPKPNNGTTDENLTLTTQDEIITNNGFYPDISLQNLRLTMRIDGTVTNQRLKKATIEAISTTNDELIALQKSAVENQQDFLTLCANKFDTVAGESVGIHRYKRAVYCLAVANLYERYRSIDTTKDGIEKADDFESIVDKLRRDYRFAISDLLKTNRWTIELL